MKIGILTFHYCHNYGAMLQAFALSTFLKGLGHSVLFVDYKLPILVNRYKLYPPHIYKRYSLRGRIIYFFFSLFSIKRKVKRINRFKEFEKNYFPLISVKDIRSLDIIIVGSDQVWNPTITNGYDNYYYGALSHLGIPHIGYAVSCPAMYISKEMKPYYDNFKAIGVRESTTYNKILSMGYITQLTIDPTLLLNATDYNQIVENRNNITKGKYVFIYNLNGSSRLYDIALKIRSSNDVKIVGNYVSKEHAVDIVYGDAGPENFLAMIKNAECTIVSSFHGTAFSIIFHKPFVYYPFGNEKDERAFSILEALGLDGCIYRPNFDFKMVFHIDWSEVERRLEKLRESSIGFLNEYLRSN